jgi:hypothetical protein
MATWTRLTSGPITTEKAVAVRDGEGREGWAKVSWGSGSPELSGAVYEEVRYFGEDGGEYREPKVEIIDQQPAFA